MWLFKYVDSMSKYYFILYGLYEWISIKLFMLLYKAALTNLFAKNGEKSEAPKDLLC